MTYKDFRRDDLVLRDLLALDRTSLANERTFLAFLRTSIMIVVAGVSLIKLFPDSSIARTSGWILLPVALVVALIGLRRFLLVNRSLRRLKR